MTDLDILLAEFDAAPKSGPFHDDITAEQAAKRYNSRELAQFHAYNPNGILARWNDLGSRLLAFGRGFLAYGDTGFYYNEILRLAGLQRVGRIDLQVTISGIERTIAKGEAFLAENNA